MRIPVICIAFLFIFRGAIAQEISQWRGPDRSGWYPGSDLLQQWPEEGPILLWSATDMGKGYSSPSVTPDAVFVTGMKDTADYLIKLTRSGERLWEVPFGRSWFNSFPDTRCTPTVEENRVYVISGAGIIACLDAGSGETIWSFNAMEKFDGRWGDWGVCESLLLVDDKVIYTPAGPRTTMVALDKTTPGAMIIPGRCLNCRTTDRRSTSFGPTPPSTAITEGLFWLTDTYTEPTGLTTPTAIGAASTGIPALPDGILYIHHGDALMAFDLGNQ